MRVVVTGGAGFVGSNLAKHFEKRGDEVLVVDTFRSGETFKNGNLKSFGHYKNLLGFSGQIYCGDICDSATLWKIRHFKPDAIFHEAAVSDTTVAEQDALLRVNLNSFDALCDIALESDAALVYASSAATYGNAPSPQRVGCEAPANVYGFSKLMMDAHARHKSAAHPNLRVVGLRYFNVYGAGEFFKNKTASMVLQFGLQILGGEVPRLFEGSERICRDFVYIKDIVRANEEALGWKNGVYNVATGKARSFFDIARILQELLGLTPRYEFIPNPFVGQYQFHTQAALNGFTPEWELESGIEDYLPEIKRIFDEEVKR